MNAPIRTPSRPRASRASTLLALALAGWIALGGAAAPALADTVDGPEVTWGVRTGSGEHGEGRENYAYRVEAGQTVRDAIIIANYDAVPLVLDVYAADGFTTTSGQLDVATREVAPRELGKWVVPAVDRVTVQPGEAVEVPFVITVPANAAPGDHAGGILTTLTSPEVENGVTVDRRLGIRIHLRVDGDLAPALAIEDLRVDYAGTINPFGTGDATVSYTVRNAGNVRLSAAQAVSLAGPFGSFPVSATGVDAVPELLPGETWPVSVQVAGVLPLFVLSGVVGLDPQAATDTTPAPLSVEASASTLAIPWTLLALIVIVAGGIVLWVILGRRRRARRKAQEDARVQDAVDRALRERAVGAAPADGVSAPAEAPSAAPESDVDSDVEAEAAAAPAPGARD